LRATSPNKEKRVTAYSEIIMKAGLGYEVEVLEFDESGIVCVGVVS